MKKNHVIANSDIATELFDDEINLIGKAIVRRHSHLKSVDSLNERGVAKKKQKPCPTPQKQRFNSKKSADRMLHLIGNRCRIAKSEGNEFRFNLVRSYKCPSGNHFHHTSKFDYASLESFNYVA